MKSDCGADLTPGRSLETLALEEFERYFLTTSRRLKKN